MSTHWMRGELTCVLCSLLACLLVSGCAVTSDPRDPFQPFNRGVFGFNERVDKAIVAPAARAYRAVLPEFVRTSLGNVFSNIGDVRNVLNNTLQGKFTTAYADAGRIFINSTLGVLGLFDIASAAGIEKHNEDFGQTLAVWGVADGPYLVLPLLGPRTTRDFAGTVVDFATDPATYLDPTGVQYSVRGARAVDDRAQLLDASTLLHEAALDPYLFVRDAYLQRRQSLVRDGAPASGVIEAYGELRPAAATGQLSSSRADDEAFSKGMKP